MWWSETLAFCLIEAGLLLFLLLLTPGYLPFKLLPDSLVFPCHLLWALQMGASSFSHGLQGFSSSSQACVRMRTRTRALFPPESALRPRCTLLPRLMQVIAFVTVAVSSPNSTEDCKPKEKTTH